VAEESRKVRRSQAENRELLLASARELFRAQGYPQTTTKQITEHAGVVESTLFRHFGSKAEIFKATVVEPCTQVFQTWADGVRDNPGGALGGSLEEFVTSLTHLVLANRDVLMSLIVADYQSDSELAALADEIRQQVISSVEAVAAAGDEALGERRFGGNDAPIGVGAVFGLVMGTILLGNWIFRTDVADIGEEALGAGVVAMVMHGLRNEQRSGS
jgi:AcrR family transcriptional regulator